MGKLLFMIEQIVVSVPFENLDDAPINNYFQFSEMPGEFLVIQKEDGMFYFICTQDCPIEKISRSFDWYIVSKVKFNDNLSIGIGLADKEPIEGELYRLQDEATLKIWRDILHFTFESNFVRKFFPYDTYFKGKVRYYGALCFYIHDYYPTRTKELTHHQKKVSNLVFRFKEGSENTAPLLAKIFSLCIGRMPFFKEMNAPILIPIPAATRERNIARFARFCSLLSRRLKVADGFRAIWIKEDREQLKGSTGHDKLSNLIFHPEYIQGKDIILVDDIATTGQSFIQMKHKCMQLGANSVVGVFLAKTI